MTCAPSISTVSEEDEGAEEQRARYEVIGKLAGELAGQIEQNDVLLYELGVMRANHARLQALAADREDELTCLNQRIRQLEATILKFNSNGAHHNPLHDLLSSTLAHLHQLSHAPASPTSPTSAFDSKIRHTRRYSWSGARPSSSLMGGDQNLSSKPIQPCPPGAGRQARMHDLSEALSSKDAGFLVDHMTDRGSLKAYVHELQAELAHNRMVCAATEATLRTMLEASEGCGSSEGASAGGGAPVQGLGLVGGPIRAAEGRGGTEGGGKWEQRRSMSSSSSLAALASFGAFGGWGRSAKSHHPASPSSSPSVPPNDLPGRPDHTSNTIPATLPFSRLASFFVQPSTPPASSALKLPAPASLAPTHNAIII